MYRKLISITYLKQLCKEYHLNPSKKYGQNYLISDAPIKKMIAAANIEKGDVVVEIGPGFGVLTCALAEAGADVVAFEIERKLKLYWDEKLKDLENIDIVWGNALGELKKQSFNLSPPKGDTIFQSSYKVVANLPYQITSHILRTLLELENKPESITVMVQKEVADRIVAQPGKLSLLSVSVQYYGNPKIVCKVPRGNFWPAPKVDSAVITIALKHLSIPPLGGIPSAKQGGTETQFDKKFFKMVRAGFSNKRKQVWRNISQGLKLDSDQVKIVLSDVAGNEKIRAQELSVEQWITITKKLT